MINIKYYFDIWRNNVSFKKYDEWCEIHNEELNEIEYASNNDLEPIYWCWNCKYSDCNIHN